MYGEDYYSSRRVRIRMIREKPAQASESSIVFRQTVARYCIRSLRLVKSLRVVDYIYIVLRGYLLSY